MSDTIKSLSTNFQEIKDNPPALTKSVKAQYRDQLDNYLDILRRLNEFDLKQLKVLLTNVNEKKEEFTKAYDNYRSLKSVIGDDSQSHNCNPEEVKMIIENAKKEKKSLNCETELAKSPNSFNKDKALACLCLTHEEIKHFYGMQRIYLMKLMLVIQNLINNINFKNLENEIALNELAELAALSQPRRDGGSTKKIHKKKKVKKHKKHHTKKHSNHKKKKTKRRNK